MTSIEMEPIELRDGTRVPGGWMANVPEMTDAAYTEALAAYYNHTYSRYNLSTARHFAQQLQIRMASMEFLRRLREFIRRSAKEYVERFPDTQRTDGTLAGFDPTSLQRAFVPYDRPGRNGKKILHRMMEEMARGAAK